jgi:hypothetical protein
MPDGRNVALLSSLRSLVRGLVLLFWGLPAALVIAVQTSRGDWLKAPLVFLPILFVMTLLYAGVALLEKFQPQERIWIVAVERAKFLAVVNIGLSPFLVFWSKVSDQMFFKIMVGLLFLAALMFLYLVNSVLMRLVAMLPDETLRGETRVFTRLNQTILLVLIGSVPFYLVVRGAETVPRILADILMLFDRGGEAAQLVLLLAFILLPVAMTMALLWKTKEVIMASVFSSAGADTQVN